MDTITPCLWFDGDAEEAANFYVSVFKKSKMGNITYNDGVSPGKPGTVLAIDFELNGQKFSGLNGGPNFSFTPAISFQIPCDDQAEIDYYWDKLLVGGEPMECGWLTDKYGVSWQVFPKILLDMIRDPERGQHAMRSMMTMVKMDLAALEKAYRGS